MAKIREVTWAFARAVELQEEATAAYKAADAEFVAAHEARESAFRAAREESNELSRAIGSGRKTPLGSLDVAGRAATKATARFDAAKRGLEAARREYWAARDACDDAFRMFAGVDEQPAEPEQPAEHEPKPEQAEHGPAEHEPKPEQAEHGQAEHEPKPEQAEHGQAEHEPLLPENVRVFCDVCRADCWAGARHCWSCKSLIQQPSLSKHLPLLAAERARQR